jgi:translation elongation factor EF-Ts
MRANYLDEASAPPGTDDAEILMTQKWFADSGRTVKDLVKSASFKSKGDAAVVAFARWELGTASASSA